MAGLLSVALVVTEIHRRPDVIRLAALWCSDFPLFPKKKRLPSLPLLHGSRSIAKIVEQWNERKKPPTMAVRSVDISTDRAERCVSIFH